MSTAMSCRLAPVLAGGVDSVGQPLHGLVDQAGEQVDQHGLIADPQAAAFGQGGDGVVDDVVAVLIDAGRGKAAHELCPVQVSTASIRNARCESRAWAAASAVAAASARMVGQQDGRGHQISFVVKVFFVVAGPGRRARSGSGSWSNWLLRLPGARPQQAYPFAIRIFVIVPVSWLLRPATPEGGVSGLIDHDPAQPARCRLAFAADPGRHGAGGR